MVIREDLVGDDEDAPGNRDTSERLVKWIHVGGMQRRKHKHELRNVTNRIVHGTTRPGDVIGNETNEIGDDVVVESATTEIGRKGQNESSSYTAPSNMGTIESRGSDTYYSDMYNRATDYENWEWLPSVPGNIELCTISYEDPLANPAEKNPLSLPTAHQPHHAQIEPRSRSPPKSTGSLLDKDDAESDDGDVYGPATGFPQYNQSEGVGVLS